MKNLIFTSAITIAIAIALSACTHFEKTTASSDVSGLRTPQSAVSDASLLKVQASRDVVFDSYFEDTPMTRSYSIFYAISSTSNLVALFRCSGKRTVLGSNYMRIYTTLNTTKGYNAELQKLLVEYRFDRDETCPELIEKVKKNLVSDQNVKLNLQSGEFQF